MFELSPTHKAASRPAGGFADERTTFMKIMLQNLQNKLFFRYGSVWTSSPDVAFDFRTPQAVYEFVGRESLRNVQLVVRLDNPVRYEAVPIESTATAD